MATATNPQRVTGGKPFSAPRESGTAGMLEFARGAARLTVEGGDIPELFRAKFERVIPRVSVDGNVVTVCYPRFSLRRWLRPWTPGAGRMTLNGEVTWDIRIRRGAAHVAVDLRDLRVTAVDVRHGANRVELRLPSPSGVVPVRVGGGASHVTIRRPAGTPVRLSISRGVADLRFDEEFGAVGGRLRLESPQTGSKSGRYDIEVSGGAAYLQVTTE
jgi:hypothetical protein